MIDSTGTTASIAPVGTPLPVADSTEGDVRWEPIGYVTDGFKAFAPSVASTQRALENATTVFDRVYTVLVSTLRSRPGLDMLLVYGPSGPQKRRGLIGKKFRAERRRWNRAQRQARKEGWV